MDEDCCTVVILNTVYQRLVRSEQKLKAIVNAGVDNWEGYSYAMDDLREQGFFKDDED
jgi:hypothetical protein